MSGGSSNSPIGQAGTTPPPGQGAMQFNPSRLGGIYGQQQSYGGSPYGMMGGYGSPYGMRSPYGMMGGYGGMMGGGYGMGSPYGYGMMGPPMQFGGYGGGYGMPQMNPYSQALMGFLGGGQSPMTQYGAGGQLQTGSLGGMLPPQQPPSTGQPTQTPMMGQANGGPLPDNTMLGQGFSLGQLRQNIANNPINSAQIDTGQIGQGTNPQASLSNLFSMFFKGR